MPDEYLGLPNRLATLLYLQACNTETRLNAGIATGVIQHEETITETVLLDLSTAHPDLTVRTFTKAEESDSYGADWIWWWRGNTRWFGGLFQAKALKATRSTEGYEFGYTTRGSGERQIDVLRQAGQRLAVPTTYALYNPTTASGRFRDCPQHGSASPAGGITVLDAEVAAQLIGASAAFDSVTETFTYPRLTPLELVAEYARPWSCLASCAIRGCNTWPVIPRDLAALLDLGDAGPDDLAWQGAYFTLLASRSLLLGQFHQSTDRALVPYVSQGVRREPPRYVLEPETLMETWSDDAHPDDAPSGAKRVVIVERATDRRRG